MKNNILENSDIQQVLVYCNNYNKNGFIINHSTWLNLSLEEAKSRKKEMRAYIKEQMPNKGKISGVYIYVNQETDACYYVGKSKENIYNRLFYHYLESVSREYSEGKLGFNKSKLDKTFVNFFQNKIPRKLKVYFIHIEDEQISLTVEQVLTTVLRPQWLKHINR